MLRIIYMKMDIPDGFYPVQILTMENGCCPDRPVVVTGNMLPAGTISYSAQCACGGWCTTGCLTTKEAVERYKKMTARKIGKSPNKRMSEALLTSGIVKQLSDIC